MRRCGRLLPGSKRNKVAIMTGDTITGDTRMSQHRCWREGIDIVADITILVGRHMVCILNQIITRIAGQG